MSNRIYSEIKKALEVLKTASEELHNLRKSGNDWYTYEEVEALVEEMSDLRHEIKFMTKHLSSGKAVGLFGEDTDSNERKLRRRLKRIAK